MGEFRGTKVVGRPTAREYYEGEMKPYIRGLLTDWLREQTPLRYGYKRHLKWAIESGRLVKDLAALEEDIEAVIKLNAEVSRGNDN
jgi:predicted hydrolase (HD superfamily)